MCLVSGIGIAASNLRQRIIAPAPLAEQEVADRHALRLPRAAEDHFRDGHVPVGDPPLELGAGEPYAVGALQGL